MQSRLPALRFPSGSSPSRRADELTTDEALDLVAQLADLGIDEVTVIGGDAFLRRDWLEIAAAIGRAGDVHGDDREAIG